VSFLPRTWRIWQNGVWRRRSERQKIKLNNFGLPTNGFKP
jgi:hypothetical protein